MRRFFTQILALALLVSLLAGCGSIPEKQADTVSPHPIRSQVCEAARKLAERIFLHLHPA